MRKAKIITVFRANEALGIVRKASPIISKNETLACFLIVRELEPNSVGQ